MPTIGQKLGETRREKGISVEDVAHETRIHPNMILRIEEDDFSHFPSVAYARSFIRKYSDYLEVDLSSAMEELNSSSTGGFGDNELMGEMKKTISKDRRFRLERQPKSSRRRLEKPGGAPLFLNFILIVLIGALGVFYFLGYKASSVEEAKVEITKGLNKANPFSGPADAAAQTTPPVEPVPALRQEVAPATEKPQKPAALVKETKRDAPPAPAYPIIKPAVNLKFEDTLTETPPETEGVEAIPGNPLRPRNTPRMVFAEEPVKPPSSGDLPAIKKTGVEPQAVLRPEGTDPAATRKEDAAVKPASSATEQNAGDNTPSPKTSVRAVPVATFE